LTVPQRIREHARERPHDAALRVEIGDAAGAPGGTRSVTWSELVGRMDAGAARLREAGVRPGERCGLLAPQGADFVAHALAILEAGACLVPVPDDPEGAALARFARDAHLHHQVCHAPEEATRFACRRPDGVPGLDPEVEAAFRALGPAYLRFTSGTTSERKGVVLSHARMQERLDAAQAGLGIGPQDRILWLLPMAHHFVVSILLYLREGATVILPASPLARPILELAARERACVLYASPFHHHLLSKDASDTRLDAVRLAVSTTDGLRDDVAARFRERFGIPLVQALGIIEVGLPVMNLAEAETKPLALGRPLPAYDVWLRDEDGKPVHGPGSPERTGEICIRGPGLFDAYLWPWTPSSALCEPDGFRTGDQGWLDADGTLFLAGRRHNRISVAGLKFFAEEVERVLAGDARVRECRVRAREHPRLGTIPVAEVVAAEAGAEGESALRRDLLARCRAELPAYKVPRELRVTDALERTVTGKLRR